MQCTLADAYSEVNLIESSIIVFLLFFVHMARVGYEFGEENGKQTSLFQNPCKNSNYYLQNLNFPPYVQTMLKKQLNTEFIKLMIAIKFIIKSYE